MFSYSIILRTLGYGGKKYQSLLDSIKSQTIPPYEFLVVIPNDYDLPKERIGIETFIHSKKGMVCQRVEGINYATGDYALIIDDDIAFPPNFVENLHKLMKQSSADIVSPRVDDAAGNFAETGILSKIIGFLGSGSYTSHASSRWAIRISALGGSIHNGSMSNNHVYYTQTGHGGCCFASMSALKELRYEEELWLEQEITYAYPDDQVFFYKAFCLGLKTAYAQSIPFKHLDAGATFASNKRETLMKSIKKHDSARNLFIFWHRFQYTGAHGFIRKTYSTFAIFWKITFSILLHILFYSLRPTYWKFITATCRGYIDGYKFITSDKYRKIPNFLKYEHS